MPSWSISEIKGGLQMIAYECSWPGNDGYSAFELKKKLMEIKFLEKIKKSQIIGTFFIYFFKYSIKNRLITVCIKIFRTGKSLRETPEILSAQFVIKTF